MRECKPCYRVHAQLVVIYVIADGRCDVQSLSAYLGTDQPRSFTTAHDTLTISEIYMQGTHRVRAERVLVRSAQTH